MRKVMDMQMKFGEIPIEKIEFDLKSRDEIPKVLIGLKHLYCNRKVREKVFQALMDLIPENVDLMTNSMILPITTEPCA